MWKVWINGNVKKYAKRQEIFFVMSVRLSDHKVLHNITSSLSFFQFRVDFLAFLTRISYFKFLELKELNKASISFALGGYETGYRYLPSHIQHVLIELLLILLTIFAACLLCYFVVSFNLIIGYFHFGIAVKSMWFFQFFLAANFC